MKETPNSEGFTLIELMIVVAVIGIISAIAIPSIMAARQSGNEASAIGSVRTVNSAQATYAATCGGGGFALTMADLATPPSPGAPPFVGAYLAVPGGVKAGYVIATNGAGAVTLAAPLTCNGSNSSMGTYLVTATPIRVGATGRRSFAASETGSIFQDTTGAVLTMPLVVAGTVGILQ